MKSANIPRPPRGQSSAAPGFSRLELVLVLATVGLLATLALAGTGAAGSSAQRVVCLDNLRRLAAASTMYATDNQGFLPHPTWGSVNGSSAAGPPGWCYATYLAGQGWIPSVSGRTSGDTQLPFLRAGQLWPYLREVDAFLCPQDVAEAEGGIKRSLWRQRGVKLTSFTMNGAVIGYGTLSGSSTTIPGQAAKTYSLSQFAPSAWLLWEADEYDPFFFNDAANQPHSGMSGRHGLLQNVSPSAATSANGGHVGLFDGSARFMSTSEYYEEAGGVSGGAQSRPKVLPNRAWCAPDSPTGGFF